LLMPSPLIRLLLSQMLQNYCVVLAARGHSVKRLAR
jgi:hypothetical protein